MKYLKCFEFKEDIYYHIISSDEKRSYLDKFISFTVKETDIISEYCSKYELGMYYYAENGLIFWKEDNDHIPKFTIFKIPDEYYIINLYGTGPVNVMKSYYKCDQMEGLLKCLEDIL